MRYFTAWSKDRVTEEHLLPKYVRDLTGQKHVPFGDAVIEALDTVFAAESCESPLRVSLCCANPIRRGALHTEFTTHCNGTGWRRNLHQQVGGHYLN